MVLENVEYDRPKKLANLYLFSGLSIILFAIVLSAITVTLIMPYMQQITPKNGTVILPTELVFKIAKATSTVAIIFNILFIILYYLMSTYSDIFQDRASLYRISNHILILLFTLQAINSAYVLVTISPEMVEEFMQNTYGGGIISAPPTNAYANFAFQLLYAFGYALMGYSIYLASKEYDGYDVLRTGSILLMIGGIITLIPLLNLIGSLMIVASFFILYGELRGLSTKLKEEKKGILGM